MAERREKHPKSSKWKMQKKEEAKKLFQKEKRVGTKNRKNWRTGIGWWEYFAVLNENEENHAKNISQGLFMRHKKNEIDN